MSVFQTFSDAPEARDDRPAATMAAPVLPWIVPTAGDRGAWRRWLIVAIVPLAIVYLSMLNRYWVPSGDGEVYTCIARSLVLGDGLTFNGSRAAIAPPGWPLVLSVLMRISPQFWFLKVVTTTCMLGAMVPAFFILRRFVSDRLAALIVLLTGTLSSLYPLTFWMHTEAFFCVLAFAAILIAFRIAERRARPTLEVPLMLGLLGFGAFTRWPGFLQIALVVPILLSGPRRPWARPTRWVTIALATIACLGTFGVTYAYLSLTPAEKQLAEERGVNDAGDGGDQAIAEAGPTTGPARGDDYRPPTMNTFGPSKRGPAMEAAYRVYVSGKWFAWLLWQPTRFGQSIGAVDAIAMVGGWLTIALLACTMVAAVGRRNYFWVGLALYTGGLCVGWPNPNARYFVPVAPFIILGVILGLAELGAWLDTIKVRRENAPTAEPILAVDVATRRMHLLGGWRIMAIVFVATLLLNNLPLLAIDVAIFRSGNRFYDLYEAGADKELIAVAEYINANPPAPGARVCVSERYENMGRARWSKFGMRALHLLTNRQVIGMQRKAKLSNRPNADDDIRRWLRKGANNVEYYVYQSAWEPWRVWHLRLTPAWQAVLTHRTSPATLPSSGGWELYHRTDKLYPHLLVDSNAFTPPTSVPGLKDRLPRGRRDLTKDTTIDEATTGPTTTQATAPTTQREP